MLCISSCILRHALFLLSSLLLEIPIMMPFTLGMNMHKAIYLGKQREEEEAKRLRHSSRLETEQQEPSRRRRTKQSLNTELKNNQQVSFFFFKW